MLCNLSHLPLLKLYEARFVVQLAEKICGSAEGL
jgi:hypothetical protein